MIISKVLADFNEEIVEDLRRSPRHYLYPSPPPRVLNAPINVGGEARVTWFNSKDYSYLYIPGVIPGFPYTRPSVRESTTPITRLEFNAAFINVDEAAASNSPNSERKRMISEDVSF